MSEVEIAKIANSDARETRQKAMQLVSKLRSKDKKINTFMNALRKDEIFSTIYTRRLKDEGVTDGSYRQAKKRTS